MLLILVGPTLQVAQKSREYFKQKGFSVIQKYNYLPEDSITAHYSPTKLYDKATVEKCDFVYPIHNGITGFYKSQIIDAVRGRANALMTMSPDNLDFIKEIKDSFGEYVQLIYLYIDKNSLEQMTKNFITVDSEIERRINKGSDIRKMYLSNMDLFDDIVIFDNASEFNYDALYTQFDHIIEKSESLQKKLNDKLYVELPYKGNKDYIFVSYSHKDEKKVLPILSALQREGHRIWYDEGIHAGRNWAIMIGERLKGCSDFLLFSSENAVASTEVENEIYGARECGFHPITVRLDNAKFEFGNEMYIGKFHNIFISKDDYLEHLKAALKECTKV